MNRKHDRSTDRNGVVYFEDFGTARDFGALHCKGFPAWRIVGYERGYAVQVRPGGDYLMANGKPSMERKPKKDKPPRSPLVPFVDVCQETAYGATVRLPFQIRVF